MFIEHLDITKLCNVVRNTSRSHLRYLNGIWTQLDYFQLEIGRVRLKVFFFFLKKLDC